MDRKEGRGASIFAVIVSCLLLAGAAGLALAAAKIPGFADWYSTTVYPVLVRTIGRAAGLAALSISEIVCYLLPVLIILDLIINRKRISRFFIHLLLLVSLIAFMYEANCGVNYHRNGFVQPELYETVFEEGELEDFCEFIIERLSDKETAEAAYPDKDQLAAKAVNAMNDLGKDYANLQGFYPKPKYMKLISGAFSAMGVSGIYSPFAIEANVNGQMPDMEVPFTSCHELSHLRGYMIEGEANYIGWLACIGSQDPAFNRSGWLIAWNYAASALRRTDPESFAKIAGKLPDYAVRELTENHEFWESHETKASEVQDKVNDAYLKSNGVEDGVSSYGRLTTLMLLWYRENN